MTPDIWRIFAGLGVPGLALGVFLCLYRGIRFRVPALPKSWVGPVLVTMLFLTTCVTLFALHRFSPLVGRAQDEKPKIITPFPHARQLLAIEGSGGMRNEADGPLSIDSIYEPTDQRYAYSRTYDVYVSNDEDRPIFITSLAYRSRPFNPRGDFGAPEGKATLPNHTYNLQYQVGTSGVIPLSPPYKLPPKGTGAFRLVLTPLNKPDGDLPNSMQLDLRASHGASRTIIDDDIADANPTKAREYEPPWTYR
jgi:hypothetical protein